MLPALGTSRLNRVLPDPFPSMRRELDDIFSRFFGEEDGGRLMRGSWFAPVALWEDEQKLYLEVELPGIDDSDIDLTVHQGTLRISAERKLADEGRKYWYNERHYGRFERVLSLPEAVDPDHIQAELHDGVLHVTLTKRPEAQPKRITVKAR